MQEIHYHLILKQRREELHLDLDDVERATRISKSHITAMEQKKFHKLPSEVYTKNFMRSYANYLEFQDRKFIEGYIQEYGEYLRNNSLSSDIKRQIYAPQKKTIDLPRFIKSFFVVSILATSLFYLGWGVKNIFEPPYLEIESPSDNMVTSEQALDIVGKTDPENQISINDAVIFGDEDGKFTQTINLQPGMNIIEITAKTKHNKENTITRQVLFDTKTGESEISKK